MKKRHRRNAAYMNFMTNTGLKPAQILVIGFAVTILVGTFLLMLPISTQVGHTTAFIDALFTSTSAVCVTGLVVVDTGTYWSVFGKTVILVLIQIGGLGFMTMTTMGAILLGKKIGLKNRLLMQEALNQFSISGVIRLTRNIVLMTFFFETVGAIFLSIRFIPQMGAKNGIYYAIFHSVSAFCNAGFDIMGNGVSLVNYATDPLVMLVVSALIIIGGLGFAVLADLTRTQTFKRLTLHSKVVLTMTGLLLVVGFVGIFGLEFTNPQTIGNFSLPGKLLASFFHSVTPRTAGFNSLPMAEMNTSTKLLTMMLMFIGGSPSSTAGGIKTTTFAIVLLSIASVFSGKEDIEFSRRRISRQNVDRGLAIFLVSILWVSFMLLALIVAEPNFSFETLAFEAISAFGTVGLSLGITSLLSAAGKFIIILLMFFGRVGPLTIVFAISNRSQSSKSLIRYPEGKVIVG
jgi:trk system potassium uptake protein TrkH